MENASASHDVTISGLPNSIARLARGSHLHLANNLQRRERPHLLRLALDVHRRHGVELLLLEAGAGGLGDQDRLVPSLEGALLLLMYQPYDLPLTF